jgi:PEP-CTERM/exosortase A-associated glycosyltransferase
MSASMAGEKPMTKILHALEVSLPLLGGYTIRSRDIINNQKMVGLDPVVITSPLQGDASEVCQSYEEIDTIKHYRTSIHNKLKTSDSLPTRLIKRYRYSRGYQRAIRDTAVKENIDIIHAHSSYLNGIRGNIVGRQLRIPTVYEVRGLWQDTGVALSGMDKKHWRYQFLEYMERKAMLGADRVIAISNHMKDELVQKGIEENKLSVVPNGVDVDKFKPKEKDERIMREHDLVGKIVLGFIGSIRKLEGLSLLIEHLPELTNRDDRIRVLLVGGGDEVNALKAQATEKGLENVVILTGQVPHEEILDYYSVIDILIYPRIDSKVTQKVSPLKPLEAMAMEKVVIGSDVGGLSELIQDGQNGLLFRADDGEHLVRVCQGAIDNPAFREAIARYGRKWVEAERDWKKVVLRYKEVYSGLATA